MLGGNQKRAGALDGLSELRGNPVSELGPEGENIGASWGQKEKSWASLL